MNSIELEAKLFCQYLIKKEASIELIKRYSDAILVLNIKLNKKEDQIISSLLKYPFLLPYIDGGLAFVKGVSGIRKRILTMSALIETDKIYHTFFLTKKNIKFPILKFLIIGSFGIFNGIIGYIFIKFARWI